MKYLKVLISLSIICIGTLSLFNVLNEKIWINILLLLLSILNILYATDNYKNKKATQAILYGGAAIFTLIVSIYTLPF